MFRAPIKKKKKKSATRLQGDSDDDEDTTPARRLAKENGEADTSDVRVALKSKKSKKKKKGLVVRSFEVQEGDDDDIEASDKKSQKKKSKKRKRGGGLGFGGSGMGSGLNIVDDEDEYVETEQVVVEKVSSPLYGKAALEKLKAEQKYKASTADENDTTKSSSDQQYTSPTATQSLNGKANNRNIQKNKHDQDVSKDDPNSSDDFVPLPGKNPTMILSGEEALLFESRNGQDKEEEKEDHFDTVMEGSNIFDDSTQQEQAAESSAWEAEIIRRAGIHPTSSGQSSTNEGTESRRNNGSDANPTTNNSVSHVKLRNQIQSTIFQLEAQQNDVDRACQRRRVELAQTQEELGRQEKELATSGKAIEDYQELREQLIFWTGALRDLLGKVKPIQEALIDLDSEIASMAQWQDWEDDMCSVLHQAGLLDRVIGRQPADSVFEDATVIVDEFGRDVKSQHAMHREKRTQRRKEIRRQREQSCREDESDAFSTQDEIDEFRERLVALGKALDVAVEELEEEYTSLSNLVKIFLRWQTSYPVDYNQCFANLSLGDLASVLVQVELCKIKSSGSSKGWLESLSSGDREGFAENSPVPFDWVGVFAGSDCKMEQSSTSEVFGRIVEKLYVPVLSSLLDKSAYALLSRKQSRSLSALYGQLSELLRANKEGQRHEGFATFTTRLIDYIKASFDNVAIVIMKQVDTEHLGVAQVSQKGSYKKEELKDAVRGAAKGQLHRLSKMLVNVLNYWIPRLPSGPSSRGLVEYLLDFMSSKFLVLLSSLSQDAELTSAIFSEVWNAALNEARILETPELMLHAAPLRAAAIAYNLT